MKSKLFSVLTMFLCFALMLGCVSCGKTGEKTADTSSTASKAISSKESASAGSKKDDSKASAAASLAASRAASEEYVKKSTLSIMPMGDSLTDGYEHDQMGAYRSFLNEMIKADGYKHKFVGAHDWENRLFNDGNTWHSGWGGIDVPGLSGKLEEIRKNANPAPDIILLMIGRNDVTAGKKAEETVNNIDTMLVSKLYEMYPDTTILLASPPPMLNGSSVNKTEPGVTSYAAEYKAYVEKKKSEGCKIEYVDMGVEATDLTREDFVDDKGAIDSVHPYTAGFEKIAKAWYTVLKPTMDKVIAEKTKGL